MKGLIALTIGLWIALCGICHAAPVLTGPLIQTVSTDRQAYKAGQRANVRIVLTNRTGAPFMGTITGMMTGRGVPVGPPSRVTVATLAPNASTTVDLAFATQPGIDFHGYFVEIVANDGTKDVDTAAAAIDQSSDWGYYPRTCWQAQTYSAFGAYRPRFPSPETAAATLNAWHCNVALGYDQLDKQHRPYNPADTYVNADGLTQNRSTILKTVEANRAYGIANLAYIPMNSVITNQVKPNFLDDGSGAKLAWGAFTLNCAPNCTLADMHGFPQGKPASQTPLGLTDPTNREWQRYWIDVSRPMMTQFGYDGFFIDTVGTFFPAGQPTYTFSGEKIDLSRALSGFYNAQHEALKSRGFLNAVSGWGVTGPGDRDLAEHSQADMIWSERHPEFGDTTSFGQINDWSNKITAWAGHRHMPIVFALYLDLNLAKNKACQHNGGEQPCVFNLPGMLYTEAQFCASGIYHAEIADNDRFLDDEGYAVINQLATTPALIQAEYDYVTFCTAQEKLLRDHTLDVSARYPTIVQGAAASSTVATPGKIFAITKARPGLQIMHLLNFRQLRSLDPQDPDANDPAPANTGPVAVRSYYAGAVTGSNKLWLASPDIDHGRPQSIPFQKGSDARGDYVEYTVPSLLYWDMAWLELDSLAGSDYATP